MISTQGRSWLVIIVTYERDLREGWIEYGSSHQLCRLSWYKYHYFYIYVFFFIMTMTFGEYFFYFLGVDILRCRELLPARHLSHSFLLRNSEPRLPLHSTRT